MPTRRYLQVTPPRVKNGCGTVPRQPSGLSLRVVLLARPWYTQYPNRHSRMWLHYQISVEARGSPFCEGCGAKQPGNNCSPYTISSLLLSVCFSCSLYLFHVSSRSLWYWRVVLMGGSDEWFWWLVWMRDTDAWLWWVGLTSWVWWLVMLYQLYIDSLKSIVLGFTYQPCKTNSIDCALGSLLSHRVQMLCLMLIIWWVVLKNDLDAERIIPVESFVHRISVAV
jgi:hypothetical protein